MVNSQVGFQGTEDTGRREETAGDAEEAAWAVQSKGNRATLKSRLKDMGYLSYKSQLEKSLSYWLSFHD